MALRYCTMVHLPTTGMSITVADLNPDILCNIGAGPNMKFGRDPPTTTYTRCKPGARCKGTGPTAGAH